MTMKVYQATDCDWFMAASPEQAREVAIEHMGDDDMVYPVDQIVAISDENMQRLMVSNEDNGQSQTFQAELDMHLRSGVAKPMLFASTEY